MSAYNFESLLAHVGHEISVHTYEGDGHIYNVAIGCEDCQEILLDFDNPEDLDEDEDN